jgi:putative sterol carrier protein
MSLPANVDEIFTGLPERYDAAAAPESLRNSVFHFEIADGPAKTLYTVRTADGRVEVEKGALSGEPTCLVRTSAQTYYDVETGKMKAESAFIMGKIKVTNLGAIANFRKCFRPLV